jgi:hypothetical protein
LTTSARSSGCAQRQFGGLQVQVEITHFDRQAVLPEQQPVGRRAGHEVVADYAVAATIRDQQRMVLRFQAVGELLP